MYNSGTINSLQEERLGRLPFDQWLFLAGIFAKQFYILPSGSMQLGDVLLFLSAVFCYFVRKKGQIAISRSETLFFCYIFAVALINSIYSLTQKSVGFIRPTVYYVFNTVIMLVFIEYIRSDVTSITFLHKLRKILQSVMLLQFAVYLLGIGRWYAGVRYQGTFNDPNQYGVFVLFAQFLIYIIGYMLKQRNWPWMILAIVLILPSSSVGTLGGLLAFYAAAFLLKAYRANRKNFAVWIFVVSAAIIVLMLLLTETVKLPNFLTETRMYERVLSKIQRLLNGSSSHSIASDRGWTRIFKHPEYMLFGAGEGGHHRFDSDIEVHSSILGPLFYYGIVPFTMLACWCRGKLRKLDANLWCVYVGMLCEALFLINTRQPMFWMLISLAGSSLAKKNKNTHFFQETDS